MDIEAYIDRYSGETKLRRLLFIARRCEDRELHATVCAKIEEHLRINENVKQFKEIAHSHDVMAMSGQAGDDDDSAWKGTVKLENDHDWESQTAAANKKARLVLQGRLASAQSNINKEAIKTAYVALAQHSAKTGALQEALSLLLRATDYCSSRQQTARISLSILELALNSQSFGHVCEYVRYIEYTLGFLKNTNSGDKGQGGGDHGMPPSPSSSAQQGISESSPEYIASKMKIASSLERLARGDYEAAANTLFELVTSFPSEQWTWPTVICAEDVALYTALLCLATQDRRKIVQLTEHPEALELVPAVKETLIQFTRANYKMCCKPFQAGGSPDNPFAQTNGITPALDIYLSSHWDRLCGLIHEKCIVEYTQPFQRIKLDRMQAEFPVPNLRAMLVRLIARGLLPGARLDLRENILVRSMQQTSSDGENEEAESNLRHSVAQTECSVVDATLALVVRLACDETGASVSSNSMRRRGQRHKGSGMAYMGRDRIIDDEYGDSDTPMLDFQQNPEEGM